MKPIKVTKTAPKPMAAAKIKDRIKLCGVMPNYTLHTGGIGGLPYEIDLTNAKTAFAIQRALREVATNNPELFPEAEA